MGWIGFCWLDYAKLLNKGFLVKDFFLHYIIFDFMPTPKNINMKINSEMKNIIIKEDV